MLNLQPPVEPSAAAEGAKEGFNAGATIIEHVSNTSPSDAIVHLPRIYGVDMSITKHVLMLFVVAGILFLTVTWLVRRFLAQKEAVPSKPMSLLEIAIEFVRESIVEPNVGHHGSKAWTPLVLTLFLFILLGNLMGVIPVFDFLELLNTAFIHASPDSAFARALHGGVTVTANWNVTAALATVTFFATIIAGTRVHGFVQHWKNLVPSGMPVYVYPILVPIEILGMFVRPFALTMRLAGNMTGGHIAILAMLSLIFIFTQLFGHALAGVGVGMFMSVPIGVGLTALELIVILVQAYVFALLTAVFIGMAIHAHH